MARVARAQRRCAARGWVVAASVGMLHREERSEPLGQVGPASWGTWRGGESRKGWASKRISVHEAGKERKDFS
jgi:hypothetical protein